MSKGTRGEGSPLASAMLRWARHWRIVGADDALDLELDLDGPAHLTPDDSGRGELCLFLLAASVDAREVDERLELTWDGDTKAQVELLRQIKPIHVRLARSS